ncbi:Uncharacterized membrane protein [Devosia crocina]|uniref:Uncharacterized membrane protein n=1 Tax=Devosia crocina TaxID=429728 RepID=A0A1I7NV95_9HYPH|nr:TadG family pilus assembly protein [Devosia crocina]SFV38513.1 Uncharacterized membrane protein [Devosia crocina]
MSRFAQDERGNMAILFALAFSLIGAVAAIGVDSAALYHERRMMQGAVDLAALTAANQPLNAQAIAETVLADAGFVDASRLVVTTGHYAPDPARSPAERFVPNGVPVNAVKVGVERPGRLYFGTSFMQAPLIGAEGLAMVEPLVSYSLGSGLASLDKGIANRLLGSLLGTGISLSLVQYEGLARVRVGALDFLDALAFEMQFAALTYDDLLHARPNAGQIARALATLVGGAEKTALTTIGLAGSGSRVSLNKLFDLGPLGGLAVQSGSPGFGADLSVLDILSAAAMLADGNRQAADIDAGLPGIAGVTATLAVGEPAQGGGWFAVGSTGTVLRTAQVRLRLKVSVASAIRNSGLIQLPIWMDIAHSEAQVTAITCPSQSNPLGSAEIAVLPGVVRAAIGEVSDAQLRSFGVPLTVVRTTILDALLVKVVASAQIQMAQSRMISLGFTSNDIEAAKTKTAKTTGLVTALLLSLFNTLDVRVTTLLGLGLTVSEVISLLDADLTPLAAPLDTALDALLAALGLGVGEADVRVYGVRCSNPVLVG